MIARRFRIPRRTWGLALLGALLSFAPALAWAAETQVAVAANFTEPAKEIAQAFKARTGDTAILSFGSSGQFYAQMTKGAPFEVFLSADAERPAKIEQDGLAVAGTRFTYAIGRLVLYSKMPGLVDATGAVLKVGKFAKLSIADPSAAPYGAAAVQTMARLGVYDALKPKLVIGSSITQAYQFVDTGAAELGFVALSQVIDVKGGSRWRVPAADHAPIDQQAILLKTGQANPAAKAFLAFLKGPQAVAIIRKYGYDVR
ncbi:MAG TPA: molybdate ABC transporter substrate-binding protein [Phenylobacterium sp.]|jgi:molybdate transport system substrate-binding protein|uniref:molybdate ABC transporter substrate-binding protein n=1 Tax=Phenylobacterium sp. TaxID=1871053 RepID=UPI002D629495|nr:molybdate ABC transporter substrate-binding protein [Phenylobacterium sp.]HZZ68133.1 molybdate ABC transporter substrate-binding protein [Phenylobacterium sp.]